MSCRLSPPHLGPMLSQCYFPEDFAKVNMQDGTLKSTEAQSSRVESSSHDTKDPLSDWFWLLPEPVPGYKNHSRGFQKFLPPQTLVSNSAPNVSILVKSPTLS